MLKWDEKESSRAAVKFHLIELFILIIYIQFLSPLYKFFYDLKNSILSPTQVSIMVILMNEHGRSTNALLLLQVSLTINCGCIAVATIAICLIIVDLSYWTPVNQQFFKVRLLGQIGHKMMWKTWWKLLCPTAGDAGTVRVGIQGYPLGDPLPLLLEGKTFKNTLNMPTDLCIRDMYCVCVVGGRWGVFGASLLYKVKRSSCGLWSSSAVGLDRKQKPCGEDNVTAFIHFKEPSPFMFFSAHLCNDI